MNSSYKLTTLLKGLNFPGAPIVDKKGDIWCTELFAGSITKFSKDGPNSIRIGTTANGMIEDAHGNFYVTGSAENAVRLCNPKTGQVSLLFDKTGNGELVYRPNDLCFDKRSNLLVTCHAESRTRPGGYILVQTPIGNVRNISKEKFFPNGIAFDESGTTLFFPGTYKHRV